MLAGHQDACPTRQAAVRGRTHEASGQRLLPALLSHPLRQAESKRAAAAAASRPSGTRRLHLYKGSRARDYTLRSKPRLPAWSPSAHKSFCAFFFFRVTTANNSRNMILVRRARRAGGPGERSAQRAHELRGTAAEGALLPFPQIRSGIAPGSVLLSAAQQFSSPITSSQERC